MYVLPIDVHAGLPDSVKEPISEHIELCINMRRNPRQAIDHCIRAITKLLTMAPPSSVRFKIGLTGEPTQRWFCGAHSPYYQYWGRMVLLHACHTLEGAKYLECILIDTFAETSIGRRPGAHGSSLGHVCANIDNNDRGGTGRAVGDHGLFYVDICLLHSEKRPDNWRDILGRPSLLAMSQAPTTL